MFILLIIVFVIAATIIYNTIGFIELCKHSFKASVAVSIISMIFIVPLGICYLFIGLIHGLLGGIRR